jgi:uncharacterized BrkB/YihY/UPF0761 family membrane protein
MSGLMPSEIWQSIMHRVAAVRATKFFNDRLSVSMLVLALLFNGLTFVILVARLHPTDLLIPVHYSSLSGYDELGNWYQGYLNGGYALGLTLINGILAYRVFSRSRITSFFLLVGAVVAAMFCLIISNALTALV